MKLLASIKWTKGLAYYASILFVLGVFLMGYFYYYIPKNKLVIHRDGFLVLQTIAGNIADKNDDRRSLFSNFVSEAYIEHPKSGSDLKEHLDSVFVKNHIDASIRLDKWSAVKGNLPKKPEKTVSEWPTVKAEELMYKVHLATDNVVIIKESIASFLEPILATQKAELFDSYVLAYIDSTRKSKIVYSDPEIGIRADVQLDTLLTKKVQGYLAGVRDIESPEVNRKIFYYPFKVGAVQLVLCGFTRLDLYQRTLRNVPYHFVYPLAITFLLLLIFLPVLKFYIIDADEQVGVSDVILFGLSVFVGASALTLVGVQYLLWQGGESNIRQNLKTLSHEIGRSFVRELGEAYDQMKQLDSLRASDGLLARPGEEDCDYSDSVRHFVAHSLGNSPDYYHFDRISWINNSDVGGRQVIKGEMVGDPVFANVRNRNYFQAFRNNRSLSLSSIGRDSTGMFAWEPIYSHTKTDFAITISTPTENSKYVVALASKMYSVVNALVPVGYGFCLIDAEGKVLVHSNVNRNLRENLFQKTEPADGLLGAIATRQAADLNDVVLYRNWHMLHVQPIRSLPYSLVTFYDKGYIVPVNMRILTFAFLFSLLSALTCLLLWLSLARTGLRNHPLLYCPMDCLTWLMPQQRQADFYGHGFLFLVVYGVSLVLINLLQLPDFTDYNRFSVVLLTPINVICALFIIGAACRRYGSRLAVQRPGKRVLLRVAMVHLLLSIGFYVASLNADYSLGAPFLVFQLGCNGWLWFYATVYGTKALPTISWVSHFQVQYSLMLTALVVCLAVLPSALFSLHAYRQERIQTVKKQQLHLATDIRERSNQLTNMAGFNDTTLITRTYLEKRFTKLGIYTIDGSSVTLPRKLPTNVCPDSFDRFYFTVAENLSNRYYDSNHYPALADTTADQSWWWATAGDSIRLFHRNPLRERAADTPKPRLMVIASALPTGTYDLLLNRNLDVTFWLLTLSLVGLLLWGLYNWLYTNTERVFLLKYIYPQTLNQAGFRNLVASYRSFVLDGKEDKWIYHSATDEYYTTDRDRKNLAKYEKEVLQVVRKGEKFYEEIWSKSTLKERYLLNDFAQDGLLNYRNTYEIHSLIERGVFIIRDERLKLFNPGFRAFLVTKNSTNEVKELHTKFLQNSTWQSLQGPLLLLLIGFVSFVFFTQEEAFDKMLVLAGGITTLLSLLPKLFGDSNKTPSTAGSA